MARTQLSYQDYRPLRRGELGYSPTARRYVSPSTGNIISVREFQQKAHGGTRYEERVPQTARKAYTPRKLNAQGQALVRDYTNHYNRTHDIPITAQDARESAEFQLILKRLRYTNNKPGSAKARALELLDRREPEWSWNIGETPTEDGVVAA